MNYANPQFVLSVCDFAPFYAMTLILLNPWRKCLWYVDAKNWLKRNSHFIMFVQKEDVCTGNRKMKFLNETILTLEIFRYKNTKDFHLNKIQKSPMIIY